MGLVHSLTHSLLSFSLSHSHSYRLSANPSAFPRDARLIPDPAAADGPQHVLPQFSRASFFLALSLFSLSVQQVRPLLALALAFFTTLFCIGLFSPSRLAHSPLSHSLPLSSLPPPAFSVNCDPIPPIHPIHPSHPICPVRPLSHLGLSNLFPVASAPQRLFRTDIVVPFYFAGFSPSPTSSLLPSIPSSCSSPFFHSSRV